MTPPSQQLFFLVVEMISSQLRPLTSATNELCLMSTTVLHLRIFIFKRDGFAARMNSQTSLKDHVTRARNDPISGSWSDL